MENKLYLAYGSNLNLEQMMDRCPDAKVVKPVTLEGYELLFRRGGFATIAPKEGSVVHGVVWRITPRCEKMLDSYEGYPRLYGKETVTVQDRESNVLPVMTYTMTEEHMKTANLPSISYAVTIWEGYKANGLPLDALRTAIQHCENEVGQTMRSQKMKGNKPYER